MYRLMVFLNVEYQYHCQELQGVCQLHQKQSQVVNNQDFQGWFYAANLQILANFDLNFFVIPEICVNQVKKMQLDVGNEPTL